MRVQYLKIIACTVLTVPIFMLASCGGGGEPGCKDVQTLFNGKDLSKDILSKYIATTAGYTKSANKPSDEVRFYVDKSSGINEAFLSPGGGEKAKSQLIEIINNYRDGKFVYYSVLKEITPFELGGTDPTNYFPNGKNYEPVDGQGADLTNALYQIADFNGLSFFVTDGEEFDKGTPASENNTGAWAIDPLKKWLQKGNSIHFWITDFEAKGKTKTVKHLFFMAFVPGDMASGDKFQNLVKSLNGINPTHLELTNTSWKIVTPDWAEQSTGLDGNLLKEGVFEKTNYLRDFNNSSGGYEFMSVMLPIKAEVLTVEGAMTKPQIYRDLKVDLSNNKFFDITKIDVDVYDVTSDLNAFAKYEEVNSNPPNTTKDPTNQATILDMNHPYACYYDLKDDKPVLKNELVYTKSYDHTRLKELFQFDDEVFKNSLKDDPSKVELAIRMHKNFNEADPALKNELGYNIIRVDFKITDFANKTVNELGSFSWSSMWKPGEQNNGFNNSVVQAIKATQPKDKVIHTLFIKFIKG